LIEVARLTLHSSKVPSVEWEVEYTDAFEEWWDSLDEDEQESVATCVLLLEAQGPMLGF
jgi:hypothetical protein